MATGVTTIVVNEFGGSIQGEKISVTAAITPGDVIELTSADKVQPHGTAKALCERMVAIENEMYGKGVETDYAIGDLVQYRIFKPGDMAHLFLEAGESVVIGDFLESAGDGSVQKFTDGVAFAQSLETLDLSDSGTVATYIKVRFV